MKLQQTTRRLPAAYWVVFALGIVMAVTGGLVNNVWLSSGGIMLTPLVVSLWGTFSLRRMFFVVTLIAIWIALVLQIERWRDERQANIDQKRLHSLQQIQRNISGGNVI